MYTWLVMAWSLFPAELSVAGTNSKPHHYKHNLQKTKDLPKTWVLRGKQFEDFRRKKTLLAQTKQLRGKHGPSVQ